MKRPSFQFYPADWRKDAALQSCSISAQGLWINLMCVAHECEPYGHLTINGKAMNAAQIGRLVGLSAKECQALIDELSEAGVLSFNEEGAIYSRRMVKDERVRNSRAAGGKAGSEHGAKGAEYGKKGGRPRKETGDKKPPLEPPPSSSSSSSSSNLSPNLSHETGEGGDPADADASDDHPYGDPTKAGLLAKLLRSLGVQVAPSNPSFQQWVAEGLDSEEALAGVDIARGTKPAPEPIPWAYLAKVLTTQRRAGVSTIPTDGDDYGGLA